MRLVFFGTSFLAADVLEDLLNENYAILAVVTRPDKPQGRDLKLSPPPVKQRVQNIAPTIPILQPVKASNEAFAEVLKNLKPDIFVVFAYGEIIKKNLLDIPPLGCINIHPSLLPAYRGAAPIQHALLNGDTKTGVCILEMNEGMDAGDILAKEELAIAKEDNRQTLSNKLLILAKKLIKKVLKEKEEGCCHPIPQDERLVSFAKKITTEEERISWSKSALQIFNLIRALSPKPGAWCLLETGKEVKRLKILQAEPLDTWQGQPGEILERSKDKLVVACKEGALSLLQVQPEGKKVLTIQEFLNGIQGKISIH